MRRPSVPWNGTSPRIGFLVARTWSISRSCISACQSGYPISRNVFPIAPSRPRPHIAISESLAYSTVWPRLNTYTKSGVADRTVSYSRFSRAVSALARARSSSAAFRSLMSRNTSTAPLTLPRARIGAAESSIGRSAPSRAIRIVWFASPTITPSWSARRAGLSTGSRVVSLTMWNTSVSDRPAASACDQPVRAWATPFRKVTSPAASVAITPSPMLDRVASSSSRS